LAKTAELAARVRESYEQLAACYEVIVIEGAGSAAELNLRDHDLANWSMAELADAQVVLVADIDRGGVFAQVVGTIDLLTPDERRRVCGVIINKFRGDNTLFDDGVRILERRSGIPVIGVVPMLSDLTLDEEDSVAGERAIQVPFDADHVNVAVILLGRMSNFTDFRQLTAERDVCLRYAADPRDLAAADVVIIPGSKNTIEVLQVLRRAGYPEALQRHVESGRELVGICGGFQMLGRTIADPDSVESGGVTNGLGWLDVSTRMLPVKTTRLVEAQPLHVDAGPAKTIRGYSIHMGYTRRGGGLPCFRIRLCGNQANQLTQPDSLDGAVSRDGLVWGTYLHGVFDDPEFRRAWLNRIRRRKGWEAVSLPASVQVSHRLAGELDRWADHLERHLNVKHLCQRLADSRPKN
jgi:adenosylcobyric acid synthase